MSNPYQTPSPPLEDTAPIEAKTMGVRNVDSPASGSQIVIKLLIFGSLFFAVLLGLATFFLPFLVLPTDLKRNGCLAFHYNDGHPYWRIKRSPVLLR